MLTVYYFVSLSVRFHFVHLLSAPVLLYVIYIRPFLLFTFASQCTLKGRSGHYRLLCPSECPSACMYARMSDITWGAAIASRRNFLVFFSLMNIGQILLVLLASFFLFKKNFEWPFMLTILYNEGKRVAESIWGRPGVREEQFGL